ncbi:IS30 family transposase [Akkermansiaceae bacterium]|nr:IS30 family transposase [Akkermansiaceae bacterium]MDB4387821.1 IS30 family transposase [Akkermansiaceae bacterium]MDB4467133.1 IS30 family transposase [Akkermansiaceae bacterium]
MSKKYRRLCAQDRKVIYNMNKAEIGQTEIGKAIGCAQSTISKELRRNKGKKGYRHAQAEGLARTRKKQKKGRTKVIRGEVKNQVDARLLVKHSPDQISNTLALFGIAVSHESIYEYVSVDRKEGGDLWKQLRINGTRRYRRRNKVGRGEKIKNRVDIEKRPSEVAQRSRYGDWEADLIQGAAGSGYLLSLYERKSRVGKLYKSGSKESGKVAIAMIMTLKNFDVKTITYDNGLEFAKHGFVNDLLGCESYFCKPYSSWEKGGVENYNGLVRQYFPKGSDFSGITPERLQEVESEINNRPRNILNYEAPNDLLDHLKVS